jgi:hypothetical protein
VNEFHDPQLENMLGRASGAYPDANVAFEAVRGRVRQVKRRRAMMASTAACVLMAGVVALAVRGGDDGKFQPAERGDVAPSSVTVTESTDVTETTWSGMHQMTDNTIADITVAPVAVDMGGSSGGSSGASPGKTGQHSGSSAPTTTTAAPSVQPTTPTLDVRAFSSKGGSINIQVVNGGMVLVGVVPDAGFTAHINEASGDRIRVEFTNGGTSHEIQLDLSDGQVVQSGQNKGR